MDQNLDTLKSNAYTAASQANDISANAPSMLQSLKQNLVGIFSKDNPVMGARETALADYLSTPQRARADLLPTNMPLIEGRNLTLSPTQQDAIVASRNAAALAPLAGLNEIIKAQYGNIGDIVQGAAGIYDATSRNAQNNATNLLNLYKAAIDEYQAKKAAASGSGGLLGDNLAAILSLIRGDLGVNTGQDPNAIAASIYKTEKSTTKKSTNKTVNPKDWSIAPSVKSGQKKYSAPGVPDVYGNDIYGGGNSFQNYLKNLTLSIPKPTQTTGLSLAGSAKSPLQQLGINIGL